MPNWTTQQRRAIEDRGGSLLVSASAGSGKTAVLVERAVDLITGPEAVDADRLLILTFSNAAAAELRARIGRRLEAAALAEPANRRLRRQRMLLQKASISTVSAFCMQLLRENFGALSIPPDFKVADEAKCYELSNAVLAEVLEQSYQDADFCEFASAFGRARSDTAAGEAVLDLYHHLRALPFFEQSLAELCDLYHRPAPICETVWGKELVGKGCEMIKTAIGSVNAALDVVRAAPEIAGYADALTSDLAQLERMGELLEQNRWDDALLAAQGYDALPLKGAARGFDGYEKEVAQQLRKDAKELVTKLTERVLLCTEEQFAADLVRLSAMVDALANAARRYDTLYFEAKLADKVLEFSDFEHLALALLMDDAGKKTPLGREIAGRFACVMVDEYQDTNALQDMLYRMLATDDESNLFLVGDVKQSIYRFRKAMPEIFIEKKRRFAPYEQNIHPAQLVLPHNFRSSQGVVDGINDLFSQLMCPEIGEVRYADGEQLVAGLPGDELHGSCTLALVDVSENKLSGEADFLAALIARWVAEERTVRDEDGVRPCRFSDFCILLRSPSGSGAAFAAALEAVGIPACADTDTALLEQPAVEPLLALLRVLDNPAQDVPLAALLISEAAGFSTEDVARIRANRPGGNLWSALCACEEARVAEFLSLLRDLRRVTTSLPVAGLCGAALQKTGYLLAAQVADGADGAAGTANLSALRAFLSFAADYDAAVGGGLSGFLRMVDASLATGRAVSGGRPTPPQGTVRIMSIHRSKGLEFPICILADTARQFNTSDLIQPVLRHSRLGVGMTLRTEAGARYRTLPQMAISNAVQKEQLSEEMRVLYVALTRAKDHLILTAALDGADAKLEKLGMRLLGAGTVTPFLLQSAQSFSQWLLYAALCHPDGGELRKRAGVQTLKLAAANGAMDIELATAPPSPTARQTAQQAARTAEPDKALAAELSRRIGWHDPLAELGRVPVKTTVSSLTHRVSSALLKRPSFMYGGGLSAAERGSALHTLLQYADFAALQRNPEGEIGRMTGAGYLLEEQAAAIDRAALAAFTGSAIFARLTAAERLLREHAFFAEVPAVLADESLTGDAAAAPVLVQGIADCVFFTEKGLVLVDYKTDHGKTAEQLAGDYRGQLALYQRALTAQFGLPVTECWLFAFALGQAVPVDVSLSPLSSLLPST